MNLVFDQSGNSQDPRLLADKSEAGSNVGEYKNSNWQKLQENIFFFQVSLSMPRCEREGIV